MERIPVRHIRTAEKQQLGQFSIRTLKDIMGGKDLHHELHRHNFFFILILKKGSGIHEIDFVSHKASGGSVFFLRPGQVHRLELKAGSEGYVMEFDSQFFQSKDKSSVLRLRKASNKNYCSVEPLRFKRLSNILTNIFEEYTGRQDGYLDAIRADLEIFCIVFNRQSPDPKRLTRIENLYEQDRFEEFNDLLERHIARAKSASVYADLLNLSTYQLNAITKSSVGKTAAELIDEHVILEAKRHLLATPDQIKDIAWNLGYEDVSYFIRFFKKHTRQSPEAFRKNLK
ncbi:MAG: helix-turn-helix domain-containing protein [Bacteroidetes bacterium]|nr:helix-turn-helix domain-containing protein [Bacteroidota bacterium]